MNTTTNSMATAKANNMKQVVIDLRPQVKHQDGHGRDKVADVYFRTLVRAYSRQVCGDYSEAAHEAAKQALKAYYSEVVELLKGEDWTLLNENYEQWQSCPKMAKGAQYLYIHPDEICGEVKPEDVEPLEAKFKTLKACEYRWTDNYGDIILTRSEADERMLYRETYPEGIADTIRECTTTKRSNLYKDRGDALGCIRNRVAIQNKRTDLSGHGTGYYRERKAVAGFVQEEYDRLLQAGYIKEAKGSNGRTLCRWINKKEEKELNKARREAEKSASDGREIRDFKTWNGVTVKGEDRKKWAEYFREAISYKVDFGGESTTYRHNAGHVTVSIAYKNDSKRAEDMSYCVSWYEDTKNGAKLRECENGVTIRQAALAMADFHLLADKVGLETIDEILNPTEEPATIETQQPTAQVKDDYKPGDRVRHNQSGRVATIETVTVRKEMKAFGEYRKEYRLDFGESVVGPFGIEMNHGEYLAEAITLYEPAKIEPQPSAWMTDYTADDFLKMEANPEAIEADGDIIGKRLRHCQSGGLGELQVFIQDYAGNERHAIYYIWDEFMQEVRANVRPLDWLRRHFCPANGWHEVAA